MYKVKVDEKLLCFTGSVNGMEYVTDPDVKLVVNGVDSFSFAIYPQHPLYKEIECKVSRVKIWRDSELLFYGEVTGYSQDMYGIRTYDCEGALAWLNDLHFAYAISGATPKEVLYWYIKLYNQKLRDKSKSFELGTVTIHKALTQSGTEGTIARSSGVYPSFWEEIQDKLLDSFGGILRVRYVGSDTCAGYIDWLEIPDGTCSQDVRYAKNLLNCDWTYDCTALATAVVPLGKRKDSSGDNEVRLTIDKADDDDATFMIQYMTGTDDLVKSGNMVYSKSRMEKYGLIQQAVTFDDITDAGTLAYQGAVWLRQNGKAASTIRAEAIDLADIDESVEHFTHGDYVRTKLPGDSAESLFPITAIEIPIAAPENAKLTVGTQESGITSESGGQGGGSIADAGSGADALAHTHSNKGVLDKITEQDYADFKGAVNKAHVHANKDTLDKIDETAWLTVYGQAHKHDNKDVLDQITQTEWNAINSAKNKAHTHDNKKTLDKIDDVSWLTVYGQTHEHSNKAVLDKLTAQDYSDFKGTVNKAHVHDNKSTLDKIDETSWLLVYGQTHEHENQSVLDKTTASYTAADKTKLDGIATGANKTVVDTALSSTSTNPVQNKVVNTAIEKTFQLCGQVGNTTDWNTLTKAGCYKVQINGWGDAATLHSPNGYNSDLYSYGLLFVIKNYNDTAELRTSQIYIPHKASPQIVTRMHNGSSYDTGWQVWSSPVCTPASHTHSYLPLSGGTMTGNIIMKNNSIYPNGIMLGSGLSSGFGWLDVYYNNSPVSNMYGGSDGLIFKPIKNNTGYIGISAQAFKAMYANTFYGALSGNASTATKLATARTINGVSFDGTANINTAYAYNLQLGTTYSSSSYTMFARTSDENSYDNVGATILFTDAGMYGGARPGAWIIQLTNRSSFPSMHVRTLIPHNQGTVQFGYYHDTTNGYFYFGVYTSSYRASGNITVLRNTSVEIKDYGDITTAPSGWTAVTPVEFETKSDSGWIATTRNTSFTATSTVKCRKYGQLVEVRGEVTFSDTCGSPTVCTLPAGYRPATVVQACGITPNGKQYMIKADASGVISFGSDSGSTFVKGTTYRVDLTYLLG